MDGHRLSLVAARNRKHWTLEEAAEAIGCSVAALERWEKGLAFPQPRNLRQLCEVYEMSAEELGLEKSSLPVTVEEDRVYSAEPVTLSGIWADDTLIVYARGIAACRDLYYNGNPHQAEAILPVFGRSITPLATQSGILQQPSARLASLAHQLACELAMDREDFGLARQAGQQAFAFAELAEDANLQVHTLISLANLGFHLSSAQPVFIRKHSKNALQAYEHAVSLLKNNVTPLLKGRTYAGIAEVYAMRGQLQEAMRAMGLAYEHYPIKPEKDPAYPYLRASRYSLYVFGDTQSRLFLGQPKEAEKALVAMQKETNDPQIEPISRLDLLYYRAEIAIQQRELEQSCAILTEAAALARSLGSRLYFDKLMVSYYHLEEQWPEESQVVALEEIFQPW